MGGGLAFNSQLSYNNYTILSMYILDFPTFSPTKQNVVPTFSE